MGYRLINWSAILGRDDSDAPARAPAVPAIGELVRANVPPENQGSASGRRRTARERPVAAKPRADQSPPAPVHPFKGSALDVTIGQRGDPS